MASSIREAFEQLPQRYNTELGVGLNCTFQWVLTGEGGGDWYAQLDGGQISVHEGRAEKAGLTITAAAEDWLAIANGTLDDREAYACGKMRFDGDLTLHGKVKMLFLEHAH